MYLKGNGMIRILLQIDNCVHNVCISFAGTHVRCIYLFSKLVLTYVEIFEMGWNI